MKNIIKRKTKRINSSFILKIIIAVVLLSGGGFTFYKIVLNRDNNEANKVTENFIQIIENKNYENFSEVLEPESYTSLEYSLDEVIKKYQQIFNEIQISDIHASKVNVKKTNGNEYDFSYRLSFTTPLGKLENLDYHTKIKKANGDFLLTWDPSLILPGMEGKDKVSYRVLKAERGEIKDRLGNGLAINKEIGRYCTK
ncbi:NTF2-like N-terminal transpeptidase domain-containing protein [Virgibacillus sp. FSP13]